jgi:hypothetical protein
MLWFGNKKSSSRRRVPAAVAVALPLVLIPPCCALAQACVADCDDSGQVAVSEAVTATRVALGVADLEECPSADANRDGSVEVDELVSGVASLLRSCPLKPPALVPSAALGVARLATHIHSLSRAVAVAFDGSDRTEQCVYGGTLDNTCEDTGTGFVLVDVDANMCRVESLEGDVTYNGPSTLTGMGRCPDVVLPFNLRFNFDWTGVTERDDGTPHFELRWHGAANLQTFALGPSPCVVKGATAVLGGRIEFDTLDGATLAVEPNDLRLVAEFRDLLPDFACEPQSIMATLDGPVRIEDAFDSSVQTDDLVLKGFRSSLSRTTRQLEIEGEFEGDCFGGSARIATVEPLGAPLGMGCFEAGRIDVGLPAGTVALRFAEGGKLDVDVDGDGKFEQSYSSCGERLVGVCAPR